ncbi:hypothetical protein [Bacteriovorax sp. BSW11_IV]|uniref:hypothetical protein n=1 Tax=Bacteriovorax sp. BSW11_IV TaxID=1353529 RepID=UPI000552A1E8|nr:hypothetical protein [Bacteriovorax sp. BSW11_IV]
MRNILIMLMVGVVAVSCSSKQEKSEDKKEEVTFQKDYVLVDASEKSVPTWIDEPVKGDKKSEAADHRYFVNESSSANKRLCLKSAEARANARIAAEIAQFIKNSYTEATQNDEGDEASEYMEEALAQEAQSFIVGASTHKTYWEKRRYKKALGADEDETKFNCYALVKMSKKNLSKAVNRSMQKLFGEIEKPEVKKRAQKALEGAEQAFVNLEKKVEVEVEDDE